MRIASGPPEALLPSNVGLLFFSKKPELFFRGAVTEVVIYEDFFNRSENHSHAG
jgi:ATP-dependent DNA helicase RecG